MSNAFAWFLATLITVPILAWYFFYIVTVKLTKNKQRSIRFAADCSCVLFMASVYFILLELSGQSFFWMILMLFFLIAFIFTVIHWKVAEDIYTGKLLRGIWRFNFIVFFSLYIVLSGFGLFLRIFKP
ncbi:DUF3397 domain-containing protein [Bacillus solitudinis]|uniref:DUF3397 domain-containing protein n=1 Tax=Bacillus solitudinis TaxID=2014074 RepID=UPI000C240318|nr:DUF3397 domain-containing protein [Bacillus solitudinis]